MTKPRPVVLLLMSLLLFLLASNSPALAVSSADVPLLSPLPCIVTLDGKIQKISHPIYVNQNNQSMVALADAVQLFSCNIRFQTDWTVQVNHLAITQSFLPQEYVSTGPLEILTPSERLDAVYVPLRRLAQDFGLAVVYKSHGPVISLQNPAYQEPAEDPQNIPVDKEIIPSPPYNLPTWGIMGSELTSRWPNATFIRAYYTTLINSPAGRTNNIILATAKINGTILESGAVFSFNKTVGPRTIAAGYQEALIFVGDEIVPGIGGGICQVSSTLYNTALEAGMQIVERHPHTLPVIYCPPQQDATVSWGSADFKFKNTLDRPLQILCCVYGPYVLTAFVEVY
jgi:hypothetical protein